MKSEWLNNVEKVNGNNHYDIAIDHVIYDKPVKMIFGRNIEDVTEYYRVHYSWKNAKRSMFNLTLSPTKTLAESEKLMAKKIKELDEKIK